MIKIEPVRSMPNGFMKYITDESREMLNQFAPRFISLSPSVVYITEDRNPLMLVGAYRASNLSSFLEVWLLSTRYLHARHAREARPAFKAWVRDQNSRIVARCNNPVAQRFLNFFGFEIIEELDNVIFAEVRHGN